MAGKIRGFYHNDLALVQLTTSFEFDSFIQPICVSDSEPQVGDLCVVAGWTENPSEQGMLIKSSNKWRICNILKRNFDLTKFFVILGEVSFQQYLDHIPVPSVDKSLCNSAEHYNGHLGASDLCTGSRTDVPTCKVNSRVRIFCYSLKIGLSKIETIVLFSYFLNVPSSFRILVSIIFQRRYVGTCTHQYNTLNAPYIMHER